MSYSPAVKEWRNERARERYYSRTPEQVQRMRDYQREYQRARRASADSRYLCGVSVRLDVAALLRYIGSTPLLVVESSAGISRGHLRHIIDRGSCRTSTLDRICDALGCMDWEVTV